LSASLDADRVLVGSYGEGDTALNAGTVYAFRKHSSGWLAEGKLMASDAAPQDFFGTSVSVSGNTALIGACCTDEAGDDSGSAYVFTWDGTNWVEQARLMPPDSAAGHNFGRSVALEGNTAVVGSFADDEGGPNAGAAHVFRWDGTDWVHQAKLIASDAGDDEFFGSSVSVSGDRAIIGVPYSDAGEVHTGSAYVYCWNGSHWIEEAKLTASNGAAYDHFGISVSIEGDTAAIGAHNRKKNGERSGSVYVFQRTDSGWHQVFELTASNAAVSDGFGGSVSISNDLMLAGAPWQDAEGLNVGLAYVFALPEDCDVNGVPDECDPDSDGDGIPDTCDACPATIPGSPVDRRGCPPVITCDYDRDGDVDEDDVALFEICASGAAIPYSGECAHADVDKDGDVDQSDFGLMQRCLSGPNIRADTGCPY
jgi:hypothetical protein